jgi:hypothetical protein
MDSVKFAMRELQWRLRGVEEGTDRWGGAVDAVRSTSLRLLG